jgi:DNA-binding TFAR19-related protein (PDSD5 family)
MTEQQTDEFIRRILESRALEAFNSLRHINKGKAEALQGMLVGHFYRTNRTITYEEYLQLADELERDTARTSVSFKRRGNPFELDEV